MRLQQVLDEALALLQASEEGLYFKSYGDLQRHFFQISKPQEERDNRSDMYKNTIGNSAAAKKAHQKRKKRKDYDQLNKKAAKTRSDWYKKNPANYEKFMEAIRRRDAKRKLKKANATKD